MSVARFVSLAGLGQLTRQLKRLPSEIAWVAVGQVTSALGAIFGVRLMTQALTPDQYGSLSLALTISTLTLQVILSPLAGSVLRFFAAASETQQIDAYWHAVQSLLKKSTYLVIVIAVVSLLLAGALNQGLWIGTLIVAFIYSLVSGYIGVLNGIQNAARQRVVVAWHDGLGAWLRYLLAVILIWAVAPTSFVAILGFTLASFVVLASQWYIFRRGILKSASPHTTSSEVEDRWRSSITTYAWPFAIWGLFTWMQASSDRWVLQYFGTIDLVGLYAALYQVSVYPVVLLTGLFSQLIAPILFNIAGDGSDSARTRRARWFVLRCTLLAIMATILAAVASWFLSSWLFSLLVAPEYRTVSSYMPWMIVGAGAFAAGQIAALNMLIGNRSDKLIVPKVSTSLVGVLLNFVGGYYWGLEGVVAAGIAFSSLWFIWMVAELFRSHHSGVQDIIGA